MSLARPPIPPSGTLWSSLVRYYRSCLNREQELDVRVPADANAYVTLRDLDEHLITRKATTTILTEARHTQPVLAYLNRRGRGISGTFIYGYPLVRQGDGLVPLCFTEVRLEPGSAPQTVLLTRGNAELLINRRLLLQEAGLTDGEVDDLLRAIRSPKSRGPVEVLDRYLLDLDLSNDAVLFASEATPLTRGSGRELQLMEQLRKDRLPETIRMFIGEQAIPTTYQAVEPLTVVPADPSQEAVLRRRRSPLLVAVGPAGSGKTQTAINLIAGALADGQRVLYVSPDRASVEAVCQGLGFPGTLQIGGRQTWESSLAQARQVVQSVREFRYASDDPAQLARQSQQWGQEVARLDGELQEVLRLEALVDHLADLLRQVEATLQHHPHRTWIEAMATRITPEMAGLFRPEQLLGIRQLMARVAGWEPETGSIGGRLRDMMRAQQIKGGLRQLGIPDLGHPDGDLPSQITGLTRLEQAFPLLLARARHLHAQTQRSRMRDLPSIQGALAEMIEAKVTLDRKRLQMAWLAVADRIRPTCDQLEAIIAQEEQALDHPSKGAGLRRGRFTELLKAFPVVLSDRLTVAGVLPNEPELFDLLIVDDASQIDIPAFLPVLYRTRSLCVLGDELGPRPATYLGVEEDSRLLDQVNDRNLAPYSYTEISVLDRAIRSVGGDRLQRLNRQHRSAPGLFDWCSEQFYQGQVRSVLRGEPDAFTLEDVPEGVTIHPAPDALSQAQNPLEAKRAVRLVTQTIARGESDLAVLTPFRGQALLVRTLLDRLAEVESDPARAAALRQVTVSQKAAARRVVILSLVIAQGATPAMLRWLEERRTVLLQLVASAKTKLVLVGHWSTLASGGPTLASLVAYADRFIRSDLPAGATGGIQPERLGLLPEERRMALDWVSPPTEPEALFEGAELDLYTHLAEQVAGRPVRMAPRLSLAQLLDPATFAALTGEERETASEGRLLLTLIHTPSLRPLVAVDLESKSSPKLEAICRKVKLPLVRVRAGQWQVLRSVLSLIPTK